jgi:hypothetical protein
MDFKDLMQEAIDEGRASCERSYDYARDLQADRADIARKQRKEGHGGSDSPGPLFMAGDRVIWKDWDRLMEWTGTITVADPLKPEVFVKLDYGGTFKVPRVHLRRA